MYKIVFISFLIQVIKINQFERQKPNELRALIDAEDVPKYI